MQTCSQAWSQLKINSASIGTTGPANSEGKSTRIAESTVLLAIENCAAASLSNRTSVKSVRNKSLNQFHSSWISQGTGNQPMMLLICNHDHRLYRTCMPKNCLALRKVDVDSVYMNSGPKRVCLSISSGLQTAASASLHLRTRPVPEQAPVQLNGQSTPSLLRRPGNNPVSRQGVDRLKLTKMLVVKRIAGLPPERQFSIDRVIGEITAKQFKTAHLFSLVQPIPFFRGLCS